MKINDDKIEDTRGYEARGVIARINKIGSYQAGPAINVPVYQFISLDCGKGKKSKLVEFVGPAPYDKATQELDLNQVEKGDVIITPGFIYRERTWTQHLMTEHLKQLKKYRPKEIIQSYVDREEPIQDIVIDPKNLSTPEPKDRP